MAFQLHLHNRTFRALIKPSIQPQHHNMEEEFVNWSGSMRFTPGVTEKPSGEDDVQRLITRALSENKNIRIVGAGHSSMPLVATDEILVTQENMKGLVSYDSAAKRVKMLPGTNIEESGEILMKLRLSMHNTGDVDYQHLGGAFGTGTHGSGKTLPNLSAMMVGCKLIDGNGSRHSFSIENDPEMIQALRVSLGALGFFTELTIQAIPAEKYARKEYCTHIYTCMENLQELIDNNLMFDFYWYPRSDEAKIRLCNPIGEGMQDLDYARIDKQEEGWLHEILPKKRTDKFDEIEYALPREAGPECFRELRKRIKAKHRQHIGWRVLYRTIAADDAFLSTFYDRDSVTIALLHNAQLEHDYYFKDMEPILRDFGGRPHWGKKHSLQAKELAPLYPKWDRFLEIRKKMDPQGIFLNDYLRKIFGL